MIKRLSFSFWLGCAILLLATTFFIQGIPAVAQKAPTNTPQQFTPTPTVTGRMAFVTNRDGNLEVYAVDLNGKNLRNISNNPADDTEPVWSPNGGLLLFTSTRDGSQQIYSVSADGTGLRRLSDSGNNSAAAWAPNGKSIAFLSDRSGTRELYLMTPNGDDVRRLSDDKDGVNSFSWAPDSTQMVYAAGAPSGSQLYVIDDVSKTSDTPARQLTKAGAGSNINPAWSPAGDVIAFGSLREPAGMYLINPDGTNLHQLNITGAFLPVWSPNGKKLALIATSNGKFDLWVTTPGGDQAINMVVYATVNNVSWSPDNRFVAYSQGINGGSNVYVVDADGQNNRRFLTGGENTNPVWQPVPISNAPGATPVPTNVSAGTP